VMSAVLREDPRPLDVDPELGRIVTRCLRKASSEQFQSATELRMALEQASVKTRAQAERSIYEVPSIAVLPFANTSVDQEQEFFSDGLAEEIINLLAQIAGLKVTARTSAFAFKGKNEDIRRIAAALGVTHVLEGSVRRAGNRIRITAELIHAADGT